MVWIGGFVGVKVLVNVLSTILAFLTICEDVGVVMDDFGVRDAEEVKSDEVGDFEGVFGGEGVDSWGGGERVGRGRGKRGERGRGRGKRGQGGRGGGRKFGKEFGKEFGRGFGLWFVE